MSVSVVQAVGFGPQTDQFSTENMDAGVDSKTQTDRIDRHHDSN